MDFDNKLPEWKNEGVEPSNELKTNGFFMKQKPPADIFNWFWSKVIKAITELQTKLKGHAENKSNPHSVTKAQVGLGNVDNTADSEKSVKTAGFASEAGVGRKVQNALTVRFKGGNTEGTDKWTFDGSTSRSVNITPDKIGAANAVHNHTLNDVTETEEKKLSRVVNATSTDGVTYTATASDITELYNGLEITIIPNIVSTARNISLNLNGLGEVPIRRPLSFSTFVATSIDADRLYFLSANTPCRLMYHANYTSGGIWLMADKVKTSAQDLYGQVPIENGGTGAATALAALSNLGAASIVKGSYVGTGTKGAGNPNTLVFERPVKLLILLPVNEEGTTTNYICYRSVKSDSNTVYWENTPLFLFGTKYRPNDSRFVITNFDKTVSWYYTHDAGNGATYPDAIEYQRNREGVVYEYIAFLA